MEKEKARKILIAEYRSYLGVCSTKGESVADFPADDAEIQALNDSEILNLTRRLKDLARTPME